METYDTERLDKWIHALGEERNNPNFFSFSLFPYNGAELLHWSRDEFVQNVSKCVREVLPQDKQRYANSYANIILYAVEKEKQIQVAVHDLGQEEDHGGWKWIPRDIESELTESLQQRPLLLHVRGKPRIGKRSTVTRILRRLHKTFYLLRITGSDEEFCQQFTEKLGTRVNNIYAMSHQMLKFICKGYVFLMEEIQNSTSIFQTVLQELSDEIDRSDVDGGIIVMGSIPYLCDETLNNRTKPLFGRFHDSFTIPPFDTFEWFKLMKSHEITDPYFMLSLYSMFGGNPHLYRHLANKKLLNNETKREQIVNSIWSSSKKYDGLEALNFYLDVIGEERSLVLQEIFSVLQKERNDQEKEISERLKLGLTLVSRIMRELDYKYNIITLETPISNMEQGEQYVIADPLLSISSLVKEHLVERSWIDLDVCPCESKLHSFEHHRFKQWMGHIIEDRSIHRMLPFPHDAFSFLRSDDGREIVRVWRGSWKGYEATEIDLICSWPKRKNCDKGTTMVFGSLKRSFHEMQVNNLIEQTQIFLQREELKNVDVLYVFIAVGSASDSKNRIEEAPSFVNHPCFAFTLTDLLSET